MLAALVAHLHSRQCTSPQPIQCQSSIKLGAVCPQIILATLVAYSEYLLFFQPFLFSQGLLPVQHGTADQHSMHYIILAACTTFQLMPQQCVYCLSRHHISIVMCPSCGLAEVSGQNMNHDDKSQNIQQQNMLAVCAEISRRLHTQLQSQLLLDEL